jgi:glycosyltransferase involved in cell wall biosynthesis
MSKAPAQIDVLMPAYNAEQTIEESIISLQRQSFRHFRLLVIDDGSTDGTAAIVQRLAAQDERIEIVSRSNGGIVDALNEGLAHCTAEIVARLDADDISYPTRLEQQRNYLQKHPDCVANGCNGWHVDEAGRQIGTRSTFAGDVGPDPTHAPAAEPYIAHTFLMARREALIATGGYRYVFHSEDSDLFWRLLPFGRMYNLPDVLGEIRIHAVSVSSRSVVNGRIAAVMAQLAALDHRRRTSGGVPLAFDRAQLGRLEAAGSLRAMIDLAAEPLDQGERDWLEVASAGKLMELVDYRPYRFDAEDCAFIRRAIARHGGMLTERNRRELRDYQIENTIKLGKTGQLREMLALAPPSLLARGVARVARRKLVKAA